MSPYLGDYFLGNSGICAPFASKWLTDIIDFFKLYLNGMYLIINAE